MPNAFFGFGNDILFSSWNEHAQLMLESSFWFKMFSVSKQNRSSGLVAFRLKTDFPMDVPSCQNISSAVYSLGCCSDFLGYLFAFHRYDKEIQSAFEHYWNRTELFNFTFKRKLRKNDFKRWQKKLNWFQLPHPMWI